MEGMEFENLEFVVDPEFRDLIPPLSQDEYKGLERKILEEGFDTAKPLIIWHDKETDKKILIDGHHRLKICKEHDIRYVVIEKDFESRLDAIKWSIEEQVYRRNLSELARIALVRKFEDAVRAKAAERDAQTRFGGGVNIYTPGEKGKSRDELGKMAGVSGVTYQRGKRILDKAPKPIKNAVLNGDIPIHTADKVMRLEPEQQEEVAKKVEEAKANSENLKSTVNEYIRNVEEKGRMEPTPATFNFESTPYTIDDLVDELLTSGRGCINGAKRHIHTHIDMLSNEESMSKILNALQEISDGFQRLKGELENV